MPTRGIPRRRRWLYTVDHVRTPDGWRPARWKMRNFPRPPPFAWLIAQAALTRPMWLNACGKLPRSSPVSGSTSSARRPDVVDVGDGALERLARPLDLAGERERLCEPERAQEEGAFLALEAVVGEVAVDEPALVGESLGGGVDRREHARVGRRR